MGLLSRVGIRGLGPRLATTLVIVATLLVCPAASAPLDEGSVEERVKAAFLFNFAKFIDWPDAAEEATCIGVLDDERFAGVVEGSLRGKSLRGRPVIIVRSGDVEALAGCEIVFVPVARRSAYETVVRLLERRPVFTVGDERIFTESGGIANFFVERGKVRFVINPAAAERAGLEISSQLLRLAEIVDSPGRGGDR